MGKPFNRVLRTNALSPLLEAYSKRVKGVQAKSLKKKNSDNYESMLKKTDHREIFRNFLSDLFDHFDEFYFETDLQTGRITWQHGLNKWLQHPDAVPGETLSSYLVQYVHPLLADWYEYYLSALTLIFIERETKYLQSRFCITFPMRNEKGEYFLVKQMSIAFGSDANQKLVSLINSFSICGSYRGEPLRWQIFEKDKEIQDPGIWERLKELLLPCMKIDAPKLTSLTKKDFELLDLILTLQKKKPLTNTALRTYYDRKIKKTRPGTLEKRLSRLKTKLLWLVSLNKPLPKAYVSRPNQQFLPGFSNVFQLSLFLEQSGILGLVKYYYQQNGFPSPGRKNPKNGPLS